MEARKIWEEFYVTETNLRFISLLGSIVSFIQDLAMQLRLACKNTFIFNVKRKEVNYRFDYFEKSVNLRIHSFFLLDHFLFKRIRKTVDSININLYLFFLAEDNFYQVSYLLYYFFAWDFICYWIPVWLSLKVKDLVDCIKNLSLFSRSKVLRVIASFENLT